MKDVECADYVDFVGGDGVADGTRHGGQCGLVQDVVHAFCGFAHDMVAANIAFDKFNGVKKWFDIVTFAGGEVIENAHGLSARDKFFNNVGTNKAGTTGNEEGRRFGSVRRIRRIRGIRRSRRIRGLEDWRIGGVRRSRRIRGLEDWRIGNNRRFGRSRRFGRIRSFRWIRHFQFFSKFIDLLKHHRVVFVDKSFIVPSDEVKQGGAVADVLGDVAGPGGDGISVKGAGISPQE